MRHKRAEFSFHLVLKGFNKSKYNPKNLNPFKPILWLNLGWLVQLNPYPKTLNQLRVKISVFISFKFCHQSTPNPSTISS